MFPTLWGNNCGQGEDLGFAGPVTKDERKCGSRALGILLASLSAHRIVSVFYLKTLSCKHRVGRHNRAGPSPFDNLNSEINSLHRLCLPDR